MDELRVHGDRLCVHVLPVFSASFPVALAVEHVCVYHKREMATENEEFSSGSETHFPPCLPLGKEQTLFLD